MSTKERRRTDLVPIPSVPSDKAPTPRPAAPASNRLIDITALGMLNLTIRGHPGAVSGDTMLST